MAERVAGSHVVPNNVFQPWFIHNKAQLRASYCLHIHSVHFYASYPNSWWPQRIQVAWQSTTESSQHEMHSNMSSKNVYLSSLIKKIWQLTDKLSSACWSLYSSGRKLFSCAQTTSIKLSEQDKMIVHLRTIVLPHKLKCRVTMNCSLQCDIFIHAVAATDRR